MVGRRRTRASGSNDDDPPGIRSNSPETVDELSNLSVTARVEPADVNRLVLNLQRFNIEDGSRYSSYPPPYSEDQSYSRILQWGRYSNGLLYGALNTLGFCIVIASVAIFILVLVTFLSGIFRAGSKHPPAPALKTLVEPVLMGRKDFVSVGTEFESAIEPFERMRLSVQSHDETDHLHLLTYLQLEESHTKAIGQILNEQHESYIAFVNETIRFLEDIKDTGMQNIAEQRYEKKPSGWFSHTTRTQLDIILKQYQEYLTLQQPKYELHQCFRMNESRPYCSQMNMTIQHYINGLHAGGIVNQNTRQEIRHLERVQQDLEIPCGFVRKARYTVNVIISDLHKVLEECVKDAESVPRYLMPWQNCVGITVEEKKKFHDRKLFEIMELSIDRVINKLRYLYGVS